MSRKHLRFNNFVFDQFLILLVPLSILSRVGIFFAVFRFAINDTIFLFLADILTSVKIFLCSVTLTVFSLPFQCSYFEAESFPEIIQIILTSLSNLELVDLESKFVSALRAAYPKEVSSLNLLSSAGRLGSGSAANNSSPAKTAAGGNNGNKDKKKKQVGGSCFAYRFSQYQTTFKRQDLF